MNINLNQFSFSKYDDTPWIPVEVDGVKMAKLYEDDEVSYVMPDENFTDVVVFDEQEAMINEVYSKMWQNFDYHGKLTCVPNYYGSVFMAFTTTRRHEAALVEDIKKFLKEMMDENLVYSKAAPPEYEEIVMAYANLNLDLTEEGYSLTEARDAYVAACERLGFEPDDDYLDEAEAA